MGTDSGELDELMGQALARHGPGAVTLDADERRTTGEAPDPRRTRSSGIVAKPTEPSPRLVLEGVLGEGGMGVVHLATQTSLERRVAVKTLHPKRRTERHAAALLREARITGSLEHPNIMPVYDTCIDASGGPQVVLKRIEGALWGDLIEDEARARSFLDSDDLLVAHLDILMQICRAAHFAHARGILHRDIKPANVIVGDFGEVCLLDWGIAVEMSASARAEDAELSGSPAYMAPEMLSRNTAGLSPATDVYLLGGCLYELLAGQPPHVGDDPEEVVQSVMRSSPPFPENAPPELVAIARRALSPKPAHRYPSANALRQAVMQYLDHRESIALSDEASRHLVELTTTKDTEEPAHHARLLRRFGACRFGFSQALRRWPENEAARRGLVDAYEVMIAHEADHANADAAAALLDELADHGDVPRSLVATVEQARRRATEQAERMAALERLGRMFDPNHQLRTRWIVTSAIALLGTVFPIASQPFVDPHSNDYAATFIYPVAFLALVLGLIWNKRHAVARNAYHRWLAVTLVAGLTSQLGIVAVGAVMQLPIVGASAFVAFGWALATGIFAATTERRAAPIPLAYLAVCFAIALSATDRRHANYLTALGHLAAAITVFVIWRPGRSEGHGGSMALDPSPPSDPSQ